MRLSAHEQRAAMRFIRDAYSVRDLDGFTEFVLGTLPELLHSEVTSYNEMRPQEHYSRNWVNPRSLMVPERDEAWAWVMHEHPVVAHYQKNGGAKVLRISDFLSARRLRDMALYSEHYGAIGGIRDCIPILWQRGDNINAIGVHRQRRFQDSETAIMNYLRPHLIEAHANAQAVSKLKRDRERLGRALAAVNCAAIIITLDLKIEFATEIARRWLTDYFGRLSASEHLPETLELWVRQHDSAVREALHLPKVREPLVIEREGKRLVVRFLSGERERTLILEEQTTRIVADHLAGLPLTDREREVLAAIANGGANSEIAIAMGIGTRTVETHIMHICERLGVSNRTAAAALAFRASRLGSVKDQAEEVAAVGRLETTMGRKG
jgi:DNA-binding NarL/FixJ family response regulator